MPEYKLTKYEKETIIIFNEGDDNAECYTCNQTWMKLLDGYCEKNQEISLKKEEGYSKTYTFPKKWLRVRLPRILSPETKAKMAEVGRALYEKNLKTQNREK